MNCRLSLSTLAVFSALLLETSAAEPPPPLAGNVICFQDDFARPDWTVSKWKEWHDAGHPGPWYRGAGTWAAKDGILTGSELAEEHHPAAIFGVWPHGDADYEIEFRLGPEGKTAQFVLWKKGAYVFYLILGENFVRASKPKDKRQPGNETVELFKSTDLRLPRDIWHRLTVQRRGARVTFAFPDLGFRQTVTHPEIGVQGMNMVNLCTTGTGVRFRRLRLTALPASEK
jgi:hypothetical protein